MRITNRTPSLRQIGHLGFMLPLVLLVLTGCGPYRPRVQAVAEVQSPAEATPPLRIPTLGPTATFVPTPNRKPTVTMTPTYTPTPIVYIVKKGDILGRIALDHDVSVEALRLANGLTDIHVLSIGQKLIIPNESMLEEMAKRGLDVRYETPTPAFPTPTLRAGSIPWDRAAEYVGQEVNIEGAVIRTRKAGGNIYLYFREPPEGSLRVCLPAAIQTLGTQPETYYLDHWIMVKGRIEETADGLQIAVQQKTQIILLN